MTRALKAVLDESNPNKLPAAGNDVNLGTAIGHIRTAKVAVTAAVATLPDEARACAVISGYATTVGVGGAARTGPLTPATLGATPTTGQVAPREDGNLLFLLADDVTAAEVKYVAYEGDVVTRELTDVPAAGFSLPGEGAQALISVEVGGTAYTINARADGVPAATTAQLNLVGSLIRLPAGITAATVKYIPFPEETVDAALRRQVNY